MRKASKSAKDFGREGNFRMFLERENKMLLSVRNLNYVQLTGARTIWIDGFPLGCLIFWKAVLYLKEYFAFIVGLG